MPVKKYPVYRVQTIKAIQATLCGYEFDFKKEVKKIGGQSQKLGVEYTLDGKDFLGKDHTGKTVCLLPEIIEKLSNPIGPVVRILSADIPDEKGE